MLLSFVLRLVPAVLADGRLAGQLEHVESGTTHTFRDVEDLLAQLRTHLPVDLSAGELI